MDPLTFLFMLLGEECERSLRDLKNHRKSLRDKSSSLLKTIAIIMLSLRISSTLSSVLCFLAKGGYQHGAGKDFDIPMVQSTFWCILKDVLGFFQSDLCPQWINLELSNDEKIEAKRDLFQKYGFPGAILCVDGTHIKIVAPTKDKFLYYNRKEYYSINAMIVSLEANSHFNHLNQHFENM